MRCRCVRSRFGGCDSPLSCQLRTRRIQHRSAVATRTAAQLIKSEDSIRRLCSGCYSDDASSNHIGVRPPAHGQSVADVIASMFWTASSQALLRQPKRKQTIFNAPPTCHIPDSLPHLTSAFRICLHEHLHFRTQAITFESILESIDYIV
jgi:hypothetical protein